MRERIDSPVRRGGFNNGLRVGPSGELILGQFQALNTFQNGDWTSLPTVEASHEGIRALDVDSEGRVWIATGTGLAKRTSHGLESIVRVPPADSTSRRAQAR
ncbi:MAG: hypothetical protein P8049_12585, partial [Gemmatimonadota bacterium]